MKKTILKIMILASFIASLNSSFGQLSTNTNGEDAPPDFSKLSYREADKAVRNEEWKKVSATYITNLVSQLRNPKVNNDNKVLIIFLLEVYRPSDTNSIEALIELIDIRGKSDMSGQRPARWGPYPAAGTLGMIGQPVINPLLNHMVIETKPLRRFLMCDTVARVLGGKDGLEQAINERMKGETEKTRVDNLKLCLEEANKWRPSSLIDSVKNSP